MTGRDDFRRATDRYYAFYLDRLLQRDGGVVAPKMTPRSFYPVNIHSCAEALLVNVALAGDYPKARALIEPLLRWIITHMQQDNGAFVYMRDRLFGREIVTRIPYLRWGQAWMFLALSECVLASGDHAAVRR
jgi:hypothetical protein